jgi:carboxymethylenebutenolidase
VAVAPELFHRTAPGFEGKYDDFPGALPHAQAVTLTTAEFDIRATFDWLGAHSVARPKEIYSVGFCLGGKAAFLANTILPLRATASFYGGGIAQELLGRAASVRAPMLLVWGGLDERIKPEHRRAVADALKENGKDYVYLEFSNADHGFFCDERRAYQPQAAEQAWSLLLEFLKSA